MTHCVCPLTVHQVQAPESDQPWLQVLWLFVLALPIACVAWTVTHEEVFREPREFCIRKSRTCRSFLQRKFFYLFTCEYCFSHWVTLLFIVLTGYRLLLDDWRGYVLSMFALVAIANAYMSLFGRLRVDIRSERAEADIKQEEAKAAASGTPRLGAQGRFVEPEGPSATVSADAPSRDARPFEPARRERAGGRLSHPSA